MGQIIIISDIYRLDIINIKTFISIVQTTKVLFYWIPTKTPPSAGRGLRHYWLLSLVPKNPGAPSGFNFFLQKFPVNLIWDPPRSLKITNFKYAKRSDIPKNYSTSLTLTRAMPAEALSSPVSTKLLRPIPLMVTIIPSSLLLPLRQSYTPQPMYPSKMTVPWPKGPFQ